MKIFLLSKNLLYACLAVCVLGIPISDKSFARRKSEHLVSLTHQPVEPPPDVINGHEKLMVGLAPYLGRQISENKVPVKLKLVAKEGLLILKDFKGIEHKSSEITISWQRISLPAPKKFFRQIIGPYASYESAYEVAKFLKLNGISSVVARPFDWEVWVAKGTSLPEKIKRRNYEEQIAYQISPVLQRSGGNIVLKGPITIRAQKGLIWNSGTYLGPFLIQPDAYGSWTLVENVPLERYLLGVVPYEIGSNSPPEALSAQAVLARTWALANRNRFLIDGYHLCSSTQCQVYKDPTKANDNIKQAIGRTSGKILSWKGKPINAVYHATNGGVMASIDESWRTSAVPYLQMKLDGPFSWASDVELPLTNELYLKSFLSSTASPYGAKHHLFRWKRSLNAQQVQDLLKNTVQGLLIDKPQKIEVLKRGKSGRVLSLRITDVNKKTLTLERDKIRRSFRNLPSTLFVINELQKGFWEFSGGGFGHGVGMSQSGAIELASQGWTTKQILSHYYPGTKYGFLP